MNNTLLSNIPINGFNILLPKSFVRGLLALYYVLAFVIPPYWMIPESITGKATILFLTIGIGGIWCYYSAGDLRIRVDGRKIIMFLILLVTITAINLRPLRYDIPWRGDEDYHINKVLWVTNIIQKASHKTFTPIWLIGVGGILIAGLFLLFSWKRPMVAGIFGGIIVLGIVTVTFHKSLFPILPGHLLRYPFVNYLIFAIIPTLFASEFPYHEFLFRIIPLLSVAAIVWTVINHLDLKNRFAIFIWGIGTATIPLVHYYSSILYLELPSAFLMLIVALNIRMLLYDDFENIRNTTAWYALILIGFIKETSASFLICFLICRFLIFLTRLKLIYHPQGKGYIKDLWRRLSDEMAIVILITAPLVLYLTLRSTLIDTRGFNPDISGLLKKSVYLTLAGAFTEQFGSFFLLFILGCGLLISEKDFSSVFFYLLTFVFISLFHVTDNIAYTGYSRFNLFILPVVLAGAIVIIEKLTNHTRALMIIASGIIAVNLLVSPVYLDGSKEAFWGNYFIDTSEHYFPYQKALTWLKKNYYDSKILFISGDYSYNFEYYFYQLDWHPAVELVDDNRFSGGDENAAIFKYVEKAKEESFGAILYQVMEKNTTLPQKAGLYHLEKIFSNDAGHRLAVYVH